MARHLSIEGRTSITLRQLLPALPYLRHPCRRRIALRARGFTLIEVLVVVLLIVIIIGMVGLNLGGNDGRDVRHETDRLAALLLNVQQEAILQGREFALVTEINGYEFQQRNEENKFVALASRDAILRARALPAHMTIVSMTLDGVEAGEGERIQIYPTGELSQAFVITLGQGEARWQVEGALDGTIKVSLPNA